MSRFNRRQMLQATSLGLMGASASGWFPAFADELTKAGKKPKRHCVLLWMAGGATQTDTFDMKPGHANGGEFNEVATSTPGLRFSEHLPQIGKMSGKLAVVRGVSTKEGDHGRGTYLMRTGHQPMGAVQYPTMGASLSKHLGGPGTGIPHFVSISPYRVFNQAAYGPGFLGPQFAPLTVGAADTYQADPQQAAEDYAELKVDDLTPAAGVSSKQFKKRVELWKTLQDDFLATHKTSSPQAHNTVYQQAIRLMHSDVARAFDLDEEKAAVRDAYGKGRFGQGCLMARRLIERGVSFIEVSLGTFGGGALGWDTHQNNFATVKSLSAELDAGWGSLMRELDERGLLEHTTIIWMGEFGRTPRINASGGRDHFPAAWTSVLAGGGIKGGQAYGKTSADGQTVVDGKVNAADLLATLTSAVGLSPHDENISAMGRPIKIAEGEPIKEILS